jgi:hypothetical protein
MRDTDVVDHFQTWKRERDSIEQEMKQFLAAGRQASVADREARRLQFATLIERRNVATRNLLQLTFPESRHQAPAAQPISAAVPVVASAPSIAVEAPQEQAEPERAEPEVAAPEATLDQALTAMGGLSEETFDFEIAPSLAPSVSPRRETDRAVEEFADTFFTGGERPAAPRAKITQIHVPGSSRHPARGRAASARFLPLWRHRTPQALGVSS